MSLEGFESGEENKNILEDNSNDIASTSNESNIEVIKKFYDSELLLEFIEKTLRGYIWKDNKFVKMINGELASDDYINLHMTSLKSLINQSNKLTKLTLEEAEEILLGNYVEISYKIEEEESIDSSDTEIILNHCYDIPARLHIFSLINGDSSKIFQKIHTSFVGNLNEQPQQRTLSNYFKFNRGFN